MPVWLTCYIVTLDCLVTMLVKQMLPETCLLTKSVEVLTVPIFPAFTLICLGDIDMWKVNVAAALMLYRIIGIDLGDFGMFCRT